MVEAITEFFVLVILVVAAAVLFLGLGRALVHFTNWLDSREDD